MPNSPGRVQPAWVAPYASFTALICTGSDEVAAIGQLLARVKQYLTSGRGHPVKVQASDIAGVERLLRSPSAEGSGHDQIEALLYRREKPPPWARADAPYTDVEHHILIVVRRGRLVAIQGEPEVRDNLWRWVHREPRPPFRPVQAAILYGAFCRGAARSLWLQGTHPRRTTKPDSKRIDGQNLVEALNPLEDASYAPGSIRSQLPHEDGRQALGRDVGTTARRGSVWLRNTQDFADFLEVAKQMLLLIEETIATNAGTDQPLPVLTAELEDLTGVEGAYEIGVPGPEEMEGNRDISQDVLDAAEFLQDCLLQVRAIPNSADLLVDVGTDGVIRGRLRCNVRATAGHAVLTFGFEGTPSNPQVTTNVQRALDCIAGWVAVYYQSGHCIQAGGIFRYQVSDLPFEHWCMEDFSEPWNVLEEKPAKSSADIHRLVGTDDDHSLFGWVTRHYSEGWLTCDDGAGEVADFVHFAPDNTLRLIHVKAATNNTDERQVSASAYEVVASQASKNLGFLNAAAVRIRLSNPEHSERATWHDGVPEPNRKAFLEALGDRPPAAPIEVVIVQPHVRETRINELRAAGMAGEDGVRLKRLETLLNSTAGGIFGVGARFKVIISR